MDVFGVSLQEFGRVYRISISTIVYNDAIVKLWTKRDLIDVGENRASCSPEGGLAISSVMGCSIRDGTNCTHF